MTYWCQWINSMSPCMFCLHISAAFDTIHHDKLIQRLESDCGVTFNALAWFRSYLSDRLQRVSAMHGDLSKKLPMIQGVPQGSCLGPLAALNSVYAQAIWHHGASPSTSLLLCWWYAAQCTFPSVYVSINLLQKRMLLYKVYDWLHQWGSPVMPGGRWYRTISC